MYKYVRLLQRQWYHEWRMKLPFDVAKLRALLPQLRVIHMIIGIVKARTLVGVITTLSVLFWLYYELAYVAPVCPYYTGTRLPPYLNKFKTIGKSYRPPFYMFAPHCQWIYLMFFCRLKLVYHWLQYSADQSRSKIAAALYNGAAQLLRLLFRTFPFTKIFRNQAVVAIRELVEAHNGAVVVLDYYLPKWAGKFCSNCGKFIADDIAGNQTQKRDAAEMESMSHTAEDGSEYSHRIGGTYIEHAPTSTNKAPYNIQHSTTNRMLLTPEDHPSIAKVMYVATHADAAYSSKHNETLDDKPQGFKQPTGGIDKTGEQTDIPPRKVIRGVLVIIGDIAVSYSICNHPMACRCGMPQESNTECMCSTCFKTMQRDQEGLNIEPPGAPTVRFLIGDALEVGYACVQVHLNVNLGMASEAFPTWTGLRCFPLTLYSDMLLDLDAALNKIGDRYPNLPINCVGVGFGANVLMEYLAVGSSGKAIHIGEDRTRDVQRGFGYMTERRSMVARRGQWPEVYINEWKGEGDVDTRYYRNTTGNGIVSFGFGATSTVGGSGNCSRSASPVYHMGNCNSPKSSITLDVNDPNYESFCHLNKVMGKTASGNTSATGNSARDTGNDCIVNLSEGHFNFREENEECMYETNVIYPPQTPSEVVLNVKRISSAVCVNLNLRPGSNALYKYAWHRKIHMRSLYGRYCFSMFKHHLISLLKEVHCRRSNDSIQKECYQYRCCHYAKMALKYNLIRQLIRKIRYFREGFDEVLRFDTVEQLLLAIHREYRQSYRHMQSKTSNGYINYGAGIYKRFGARAAADFKFSALMTLRYVYTQVEHDNRSRIETLSGPAVYTIVNRRVNTNLRIGKANLYSGINKLLNQTSKRLQNPKVYKYLAELINREYTQNVSNIRKNFTSIKIPTLLLSSLDNSLCTLEEIDILDVIKNPNIVYYVAKSGGYSTFLSGTYPSAWFSGPILEFLDEMSSRRVIL